MNDAAFFALLDAVERAVRDKSAVSRTALIAALAAGVYPRDAVWSALRQFEGEFYKTLADAYSQVLDTTFGIQKIRALPVSGLALSTNLYGFQQTVSEEVLGVIVRHTKGMMEGRTLAMDIYEGYGFKDGADPLKLTPSNKVLPKYLREVLNDDDLRTQMQRVIVRGQVTTIKTPALRAAYMQALDEVENGVGTARLDKAMKVALDERQRYYANRIAQTELARAYSDEKAREFMAEPALTVLQWKMSITHPAVDICDMHANLDKYRLGPGCYPKELAPKPPAHPHCLLGDTLITASGRILAVSKRWFDGNIVVITTASGKRISATVNHPILTPAGWVGAGALDVGDEVISRVDSVSEILPPVIDNQHQNVPASIAEIADAFSRSGKMTAREVPISAENFHGDGVAGQIAVIWADGELGYGVDTASHHVGHDHFFQLTESASTGLLGNRVVDLGLEALVRSTDGSVSIGSKSEALGGSHSGHSDDVSFATVSQVNAGHRKSFFDDVAGDAELARQIKNGATGEVFFDEIVDVKRDLFSGHVFNLETEHGHYTGNGIITHNCRCILQPRWDLNVDNVKSRSKAEQAYLIEAGDKAGAKIMGSYDKWKTAKSGKASVEDILNAGKDPLYHLAVVGDVV